MCRLGKPSLHSVMKLQKMKRNKLPSKLQTADSEGKISGKCEKHILGTKGKWKLELVHNKRTFSNSSDRDHPK